MNRHRSPASEPLALHLSAPAARDGRARAAAASPSPGARRLPSPAARRRCGRRRGRRSARLIIAAAPICSIAQHPEQLAESVEPLLEQRVDRFVGAVARRDAGAAGRDDRPGRRRSRELPLDRARAPAPDRPSRWPGRRPRGPRRVSRSAIARPLRVGGLGAGVADREDEAAHRAGACALCSVARRTHHDDCNRIAAVAARIRRTIMLLCAIAARTAGGDGRRAGLSAACRGGARHPQRAAGAGAAAGRAGAGRRRSARALAAQRANASAPTAPATPGVYVLRDAAGRRAVRRQGHQPPAPAADALRRAPLARLKAPLARAVDAEWHEVGSELEALLREADADSRAAAAR